jgi:FKBP-type peptidyl-prolyl cis-trans isomerase FkpA
MTRVLIICLCVLAFAGCKKSTEGAKQAQVQAEIDDKLIKDYIAKNNLTATKVMIGSQDTTGVWYINTVTGTENTLFTNSSLLTVGYTGRVLGSSTVFIQTNTYHPSYHLGDMIRGWQFGIIKSQIRKGGKIRLLIASRYAYGPYDQPTLGIPANSVLDFDIELFDVTN